MKGVGRRLYAWADERLGLEGIKAIALAKKVPIHRATFWYYWGGITLFFFIVQAVTGAMLLIYYRPGADAYQSVREITYELDFGWLIRSIHAWSAALMVASAFVHMFSVFFMKAFRKPREFGWWSGLALIGLTMVFGFSGYLLPMDTLAYFATNVGLDIPSKIPGVGPLIDTIARGGPDVSEVTIQRFFGLHVLILPVVFMGILGVHLLLIVKHGNAVPDAEAAKPEPERRTMPFFPNFMAKDLAVWLIALNVLVLLAAVYPWQLGQQADPLMPAPAGIHPEWYFMSQFQAFKVLGNAGSALAGEAGSAAAEYAGIGLFAIGGLLWAMIPLYDRDSTMGVRARRMTWIGLLALLGLIGMTIWGYAALE